MSLRAAPITLEQANAFVAAHHRHSPLGMVACRFTTAAVRTDGLVVGVVIAGNPKARLLDGGWELEVNRICTDGYRNACSFLYARAVRFGKAAGFSDLFTYTTNAEDGASLKASGWTREIETKARDWKKERGPGRTAGGTGRARWHIHLCEPVELRWPASMTVPAPPSLFDAVEVAA